MIQAHGMLTRLVVSKLDALSLLVVSIEFKEKKNEKKSCVIIPNSVSVVY